MDARNKFDTFFRPRIALAKRFSGDFLRNFLKNVFLLGFFELILKELTSVSAADRIKTVAKQYGARLFGRYHLLSRPTFFLAHRKRDVGVVVSVRLLIDCKPKIL